MTKTAKYRKHYLDISTTFPSAVALKIFLGDNPKLSLKRNNLKGKKICEIGFGDGRDLNLFKFLSMNVYGVEPDSEVVKHTINKFEDLSFKPVLKVGSNVNTGFKKSFFDIVYASASIYYLPSEDYNINDALEESCRILKKGGTFFATFAREGSHVTKKAKKIDKNTLILEDIYYKLRKGQRYHIYNNKKEIKNDLTRNGFKSFFIGEYDIDWFGTRERLYIVGAKKI